MSGGHYDYASSVYDLGDLYDNGGFGKREGLGRIRDALAALGYAQDAAEETEELLVLLRQWEVRANVRIERLQPVWHALEWWHSADWSEEGFKDALAAYRNDNEGEAP